MATGAMPRADVIVPVAVQLLHDRPELRDSFPIADQVDMAVRAGA